MKRLLNLLHNLLKRGCLRIFPKPHFCVLLSLSLLTVYSCSTSRHVSGLVEHTSTDTLSLSQVQYDSIYIFQDRLLDRSRDTVYLRDVSVECRYKLLRDTVYRTRVDSVPVIREVEVVREVPHVPWWARFCRAVTVAAALAVIAYLACVFRFRPPSRGVTHR